MRTDRTTVVSERLHDTVDVFAAGASQDLGLPVAFVRDQILYAASAIAEMSSTYDERPLPRRAEVAFQFPSNTEGAMPAFLVTLATSMGYRVHVKLSQRCPRIAAALRAVFGGMPFVSFHEGSGAHFLETMLAHPDVHFVQVFGDDAWIAWYREAVQVAGKTLAFDGPGKDAIIVLPGADVQAAVGGAVASGLFAGGAACMSAERFIVYADLADEFLDLLVGRLRDIRPLPPDSPAAMLGFQSSERAAERMQRQIAEAIQCGAVPLLAGSVTPVDFAGRRFHACGPTVLADVPLDAPLMQDETFGPVFPVVTFRSLDEALAIAEGTRYGLTATVFGPSDLAQSVASRLRRTHAITYVNQTMLEGFEPDYWGSGGFQRSGWVWEPDEAGRLRTRSGFRPLRLELERVLARLGKEIHQ